MNQSSSQDHFQFKSNNNEAVRSTKYDSDSNDNLFLSDEKQTSTIIGDKISWRVRILGPLTLIILVLSSSAVAPFSTYIPVEKIYLRNLWRTMISLIYIIPIAALNCYVTKFNFKCLFKADIMRDLTIGSICIAIYMQMVVYSSEVTLISHSILFSNCGGVVMIIGMIITRVRVSCGETVGTLIAIAGCGISMMDPYS
jgi:hypothetical protein